MASPVYGWDKSFFFRVLFVVVAVVVGALHQLFPFKGSQCGEICQITTFVRIRCTLVRIRCTYILHKLFTGIKIG
jgi:hypothetical protein